MFLRSLTRNTTSYNPKISLFFTLLLGIAIFGYFYYFGQLKRINYPYIKQKENLVLLIERNNGVLKDTVSWLYHRVNRWRYFGTNLGLYQEDSDSLIAEFRFSKNSMQAVYDKIPFYSIFDKSGQKYGISIMIPKTTENSRWKDLNLGFEHKILENDTLNFNNQKIACIVIETKLSTSAVKIIKHKLLSRSDKNIDLFDKISSQSWLNWYSAEHGWLQSVYPDGKKLTVIEIKDIFWFERISRYLDFGIYSGKINF